MRTCLLIVHIAAGNAGLILGPVALALPHRVPWRPRVIVAYRAGVMLVCFAAFGLVALKPEVWGLGLIALGTLAAVSGGAVVGRRRRPGWQSRYASLMGGSYISLVTAFLVVNVGGPVAWVLPSVVGSPLVARAARRAGKGDVESAGARR
jgi:hypothetical protein